MKKGHLIIMTAILMVATGAYARPGRMGGKGQGKGPGAMLMRCIRIAGIQLSSEQIEKLQVLKDQIRLEMDKIRPQLRKLGKEAFLTLTDPAKSNDEVFKKILEIREKRQKLFEPILKKGLEVRQILTREQLNKLRSTPQCLQPRMFWRGKPGMGRGRGMKGMGPGRFRRPRR